MKTLLALSLALTASIGFAKDARIICHTPNKEKSFVINKYDVAFFKADETRPSGFRTLASLSFKGHAEMDQGFNKTLYKDGLRHRISINDTSNFNEVDDYISITSRKGHVMSYPLNCEAF